MVVTVNVSVQVWQHTLTAAASREFLLIGGHPPYAVSNSSAKRTNDKHSVGTESGN